MFIFNPSILDVKMNMVKKLFQTNCVLFPFLLIFPLLDVDEVK